MYYWPMTTGILGIMGNFVMISLLIFIFRRSIFDVAQQNRVLMRVSEDNLSSTERILTDLDRSYLPLFRDVNSNNYSSIGNAIVNASNIGLIPAIRLVSLSTKDVHTVFRTGDQRSVNGNDEANDIESVSSTGNIYSGPSMTSADNIDSIQNASTVDNDADQDNTVSMERKSDGSDSLDQEQQTRGLDNQRDITETVVSGSISRDDKEFVIRRRRPNESDLSNGSEESTEN